MGKQGSSNSQYVAKHPRLVLIDGYRVPMTGTTYAYFMHLWNARGRALTDGQLIELISDSPDSLANGHAGNFLCKLRAALRPTRFRVVIPIWGQGHALRRLPPTEPAR